MGIIGVFYAEGFDKFGRLRARPITIIDELYMIMYNYTLSNLREVINCAG